MNATINAGQFNSRYNHTTAPISAIVSAILKKTHRRKKGHRCGAARFACSSKQAQREKKAFGTAQHAPPSSAEQKSWDTGDQAGDACNDDGSRELQEDDAQHTTPMSCKPRDLTTNAAQFRKPRDYKG
ncbi:hypothetical protein ACFS07_00795 [Undibacterium arcticum]